MRSMPLDLGHLHFVGIGGIGMSGIAEILNAHDYTVQGSDLSESANVQRLQKHGMRVLIGHDAANIKNEAGENPAAVVISTAIKNDNPELKAAREAGVPIVRRADMLAELTRLKWTFAVSGTHGKTTTTSLVGQMLDTAGLDPTIINGGIVNAYGTNTRLGESEYMVVEADESDGTFIRLPASVAVVTNMDPEHLDYYGSFEEVRKTYRQFIHNLPFYGYAMLCIDHPEVQSLIADVTDRRVITYGLSPQADVRAVNIRQNNDGSIYDVEFADGSTIRDIALPMLGQHNIQNSLVAIGIAHEMDIKVPLIKKALKNFSGVKRRFTKTGETNGITIIDDYAHHPVEIETVLKAARSAVKGTDGKVIVVMQPHRYSRLKDLFEDFCTCFHDADTVIVSKVYPAGEEPLQGYDSKTLITGIESRGHKHVLSLEERKGLAPMLADICERGDYVVCMGAGDITYWAYDLPKELEAELQSRKGNAA